MGDWNEYDLQMWLQVLAQRRPSERQFVSYAVVRDKNYRTFLNSEIQVIKTLNEAKKLSLIGEAAKLVGFLIECPQCLRLLLFRPGNEVSKNTPLFFVPELDMPKKGSRRRGSQTNL